MNYTMRIPWNSVTGLPADKPVSGLTTHFYSGLDDLGQ